MSIFNETNMFVARTQAGSNDAPVKRIIALLPEANGTKTYVIGGHMAPGKYVLKDMTIDDVRLHIIGTADLLGVWVKSQVWGFYPGLLVNVGGYRLRLMAYDRRDLPKEYGVDSWEQRWYLRAQKIYYPIGMRYENRPKYDLPVDFDETFVEELCWALGEPGLGGLHIIDCLTSYSPTGRMFSDVSVRHSNGRIVVTNRFQRDV